MRPGWFAVGFAVGAVVGVLLAAWAEGSWRRPQVVEFGLICAFSGGLIGLVQDVGWLF